MKHRCLLTFAVLLLLTRAGALFGKEPGKFIWLSDLHFDPTANPKLVDQLAAAEVFEWPAILTTSPAGMFSKYAEDSNWPLLSSATEAVRKVAPGAQFTVVTGDVLVHRFREKYEAAATDKSNDAFRRFVAKTMQFVALQLRTLHPGAPVLLTLGNNDSECGDYQIEPGGTFLKDSAVAIAGLLGSGASPAMNSDWLRLGSYDIPHPVLKKTRIVVLNSVFFSPRYSNACGSGATDPAAEQMRWLSDKVARAAQRKERVWLLFHIPPGIDGYATARQKSNGTPKIVYMWKPELTAQFDDLLSRYKETVTVSLAGHEHMDDFRLLTSSLVIMAPGLSPVVRQNPAFRVVTLTKGGELLDEDTYYLSNLDQSLQGAEPKWELEYNFAKDWKLRSLNFENFRKLYQEIEQQGNAQSRWSELYSVSHTAGSSITPESFADLFCASGNIDRKSYEGCVSRISAARQ